MTAAVMAAINVSTVLGRRCACRHAADHAHRTAHLAVPELVDDEVVFRAPDGSYSDIPAWFSQDRWLEACRRHPDLASACRGRLKVPMFLKVMLALSCAATQSTGRDIAVAHATLKAALGVSVSTIRRAEAIGQELNLLVKVLEGAHMTMAQREVVIKRYWWAKDPTRTWRKLPNFYAATMPPAAAATPPPAPRRPSVGFYRARTVDNGRSAVYTGSRLIVTEHLPRRGRLLLELSYTPDIVSKDKTFGTPCGRPNRSQPAPAGRRTTVAALPTGKTHLEKRGKSAGALTPELEAYAEAVRSLLPGYRRVSLRRISNALSSYVHGGVSPSRLLDGLDRYLAATWTSWITEWRPGHEAQQAMYLVGKLKQAREAGFIEFRD